MPDVAQVRNAASPRQVKRAESHAYQAEERARRAWGAVLGTYEGRHLLWILLGHCKTFESIYEASARIYYNAGRQDFGHLIIAQIGETNPSAWLQMQQEAQQRLANDVPTETDA